jgi:hypothetical protein
MRKVVPTGMMTNRLGRFVAVEDARSALQHADAAAQVMGRLAPGTGALTLD